MATVQPSRKPAFWAEVDRLNRLDTKKSPQSVCDDAKVYEKIMAKPLKADKKAIAAKAVKKAVAKAAKKAAKKGVRK